VPRLAGEYVARASVLICPFDGFVMLAATHDLDQY